ncbi:MAG: outer membrane beta-barrel protein [Melioribacteraceae bacterium]
MKRIILIIFFLSFFLIENLSAQNNFSLSLGGGYVSSAIDKTKLPYWENGYLINFSSYYNLTDKIALFFSSSFQQHYFNENFVNLVVPAVAGYRYSISGKNSSVFDFTVGGKLYMTYTKIKPYLGIGTGLLLINQGKVEITNWMEGNPNKSTSLYSDTDKNFSLAQINFGIGLEIELIDNFQLVLDGKLINSFGGPSYFPLTASIKLGL